MDEFQDLPIQFGQVLRAKNVNGCGILLVELGGIYKKKIHEMRIGVFPCHGMAELPRILLGRNEAT